MFQRVSLEGAQAHPPAGLEAGEGQPAERAEVAEGEELIALGCRDLSEPAGADFHFAKIRIVDRNIPPHEAHPAAARAIWIANVDAWPSGGGWLRVFGCLAVSAGDKVLEIFQARFEWFHG